MRIFIGIFIVLNFCCAPQKTETINVLIVDGQNNHGIWPKTTAMMKSYLEGSGLFDVDVVRTQFTWQGPDSGLNKEELEEVLDSYTLNDGKEYISLDAFSTDPEFTPSFSDYDVVISNFGWKAAPWPTDIQTEFEEYIHGGGGLVIIHAANNSFGKWGAFNKMIGLGGWGDRNTQSGPYVYIDESGEIIRDSSEGICGSHGPEHEFLITIRAPNHPITKGMPEQWLHAKDEIYDRLRGPAENMTILATAYSDIDHNAPPWDKNVTGSGRHEPMMMVVEYGKGRIFHTPLGHGDYSMECVGFISALLRGTEWAATGNVTQELTKDFPNKDIIKTRSWNNEN